MFSKNKPNRFLREILQSILSLFSPESIPNDDGIFCFNKFWTFKWIFERHTIQIIFAFLPFLI